MPYGISNQEIITLLFSIVIINDFTCSNYLSHFIIVVLVCYICHILSTSAMYVCICLFKDHNENKSLVFLCHPYI